MIVNMSDSATEEQIDHIIQRIREAGFQPHVTRGTERTIVAAVGSGGRRHEIEALSVAPGVDNVVALANLALARGWLGREGCGLLPIRGHSNVQGVGSVGFAPALRDAFARKMEEVYGIPRAASPGLRTPSSRAAERTLPHRANGRCARGSRGSQRRHSRRGVGQRRTARRAGPHQ